MRRVFSPFRSLTHRNKQIYSDRLFARMFLCCVCGALLVDFVLYTERILVLCGWCNWEILGCTFAFGNVLGPVCVWEKRRVTVRRLQRGATACRR